MDVRGYGLSTRPTEMDRPAGENQPVARTEVAMRDVGAAVRFILECRGILRLCLVGWSWVDLRKRLAWRTQIEVEPDVERPRFATRFGRRQPGQSKLSITADKRHDVQVGDTAWAPGVQVVREIYANDLAAAGPYRRS